MHYLSEVPQVARPLKVFGNDRRQKLVQLADLVLKTQGNVMAGRTVRYLLSLVDVDAEPNPVIPLEWLSQRTPGEFDGLINLNLGQKVIGRILPQMEFCARIQRIRRT